MRTLGSIDETARCAPSVNAKAGKLPRWLTDRRVLLGGAGVLALSGLVVGWPTLTSAAVLPTVLALAPCALMCALGLCMNRAGRRPNEATSDSKADDGGKGPAPLSARASPSCCGSADPSPARPS